MREITRFHRWHVSYLKSTCVHACSVPASYAWEKVRHEPIKAIMCTCKYV